jgi:hypothetical protein
MTTHIGDVPCVVGAAGVDMLGFEAHEWRCCSETGEELGFSQWDSVIVDKVSSAKMVIRGYNKQSLLS